MQEFGASNVSVAVTVASVSPPIRWSSSRPKRTMTSDWSHNVVMVTNEEYEANQQSDAAKSSALVPSGSPSHSS